MEDSGRVIFGQNRTNQNPLNKLLWGNQNVETMATVLHTRLQNLYESEKQSTQHVTYKKNVILAAPKWKSLSL